MVTVHFPSLSRLLNARHRDFVAAAMIAIVFLAFSDCCLAQDDSPARKTIVVERAFIKSFQEIDVPALKAGLLEEVLHREGESVRSGEILAKLQDHQAAFALEQAETQAKIARHLADNRLELDNAEKKLQQAEQGVKQQDLVLQAAKLEAKNVLRAQAAEKSEAVAKNQFERAKQSKARFVDSVSDSELDGLRLAFEKASLETAQAMFDMQLAQLKALAAEEARQTLLLAIESSKFEVSQAQSKVTIAKFNAELKQAELKVAKLHVDQHHLRSKLEGIVVDIYRQPGEWVEPGEAVLRILRLNRLRAEAFLKVDELSTGLENAKAELEVTVDNRSLRMDGVVTFVSPEIDPINRETSVWIEFENRELLVKPGMHGALKIYPKRLSPN